MRIIVNGAGGRMGRVLCAMIEGGNWRAQLVGASGRPADPELPVLEEVTAVADCIIDVSHHSATEGVLHYAMRRRIPVVMAVTGHTAEEQVSIRSSAE